MAKKVIYGIFVVIIGFLVFQVSSISLAQRLFREKVFNSVDEKNHDFILRSYVLTTEAYYDPTPIYSFQDEENSFNMSLYEFYAINPENSSTNFEKILVMLFTELNLDKISLEKKVENKVSKDYSSINFHFAGLRIHEEQEKENVLRFGLDLANYNGYLIFATLTDFELKKENYGLVLENIEFIDSSDNVIYEAKNDPNYSSIDIEGLRGEELKNFEKCYTYNECLDLIGYSKQTYRIAINVGIYLIVAGGLGFLLFKKRKTRRYGR